MTKTYILNKNLKGKLQRKSCVSLSKSARPSLNLAGNLVESNRIRKVGENNENQPKPKERKGRRRKWTQNKLGPWA